MLKTCNKQLDEIIFKSSSKVVFYGRAGVGKTSIALNIIKCTLLNSKQEMKAIYISTEGSITIDRVVKMGLDIEGLLFAIALDQMHLNEILIDIMKNLKHYNPIVIVVDSVNSFYRVIARDSVEEFIETLIILDYLNRAGVGVISTAQVGFDEELGREIASGIDILNLWADYILEIDRVDRGVRQLRFYKPKVDKEFKFVITDRSVLWIPSRYL